MDYDMSSAAEEIRSMNPSELEKLMNQLTVLMQNQEAYVTVEEKGDFSYIWRVINGKDRQLRGSIDLNQNEINGIIQKLLFAIFSNLKDLRADVESTKADVEQIREEMLTLTSWFFFTRQSSEMTNSDLSQLEYEIAILSESPQQCTSYEIPSDFSEPPLAPLPPVMNRDLGCEFIYDHKGENSEAKVRDENIGLVVDGQAVMDGSADLSSIIQFNDGGKVYAIRLIQNNALLYGKYAIAVDAEGPEGLFSGNGYLRFVDKSGDYYDLRIYSHARNWHYLGYNSKKPEIIKIIWSNNTIYQSKESTKERSTAYAYDKKSYEEAKKSDPHKIFCKGKLGKLLKKLASLAKASPAKLAIALAAIAVAVPAIIAFLSGGPVTKASLAPVITVQTATIATALSVSVPGAFGIVMAASVLGVKQVSAIFKEYDVTFEADENGDPIAILTKKEITSESSED